MNIDNSNYTCSQRDIDESRKEGSRYYVGYVNYNNRFAIFEEHCRLTLPAKFHPNWHETEPHYGRFTRSISNPDHKTAYFFKDGGKEYPVVLISPYNEPAIVTGGGLIIENFSTSCSPYLPGRTYSGFVAHESLVSQEVLRKLKGLAEECYFCGYIPLPGDTSD